MILIGRRGTRLRSGRKGISELVAALILIVIVIAGSLIVYVYSSGMLGSLQGAQPQQQYTNQIALEYYDWTTRVSSTLQKLNITLRNVGSGRGVLAAFYVGNGTTTTQVTLDITRSTCSMTTVLAPQQSCRASLVIPSSFKISSLTAYNVKVVTKDGAIFVFSCIAGRSTGSF